MASPLAEEVLYLSSITGTAETKRAIPVLDDAAADRGGFARNASQRQGQSFDFLASDIPVPSRDDEIWWKGSIYKQVSSPVVEDSDRIFVRYRCYLAEAQP